jgi:hypothetical protein
MLERPFQVDAGSLPVTTGRAASKRVCIRTIVALRNGALRIA